MGVLGANLDVSLMYGMLNCMERREGFARQRLCVIPRPVVTNALTRPVTSSLLVTDAGWFPEARDHLRVRPHGAPETVLLVCTDGQGWVDVGHGRITVEPGTAALIPRGTPHSYGAQTHHPWTIWWCHLQGEDLDHLWHAIGSEEPAAVFPLQSPERITTLVEQIVAALERDHSPPRLLVTTGLAWHLMTQLAADRRLAERSEPLERAMRVLDERAEGSIRVSELARLVGVSPSHLGALFRAATGGGVLAYHRDLKMARARRLLDTTTLNITEIADRIGYTDPFYFSRQFRRVHGTSPSDYRRLRKG